MSLLGNGMGKPVPARRPIPPHASGYVPMRVWEGIHRLAWVEGRLIDPWVVHEEREQSFTLQSILPEDDTEMGTAHIGIVPI